MTQTFEQSPTFALVRKQVREKLTQSQAFRQLPPETQRQLAHDMVKVAGYIVSGEDGQNMPAAAALAGDATSGANLPGNIPRPGATAGSDFQAAAAKQGGTAFTQLVRDINFPQFVAGLIDGVFNAIVDASIKQMEAYAELVKNVAKSVDQFMKDNVSENQARDYLADRYPDFLEVDVSQEQPQVKPTEGYDQDNMPDFFRDLGLETPVEDLDEEVTEQVLVPAARRRMAMDRQQLLATMVLMGINRIVVTNGNITASVIFQLKTRDVVERDFTQTAEQAGGKYASSQTRPGFWGWFSPSVTREYESSWGRFKVTTVQEEDSEASVEMKANLSGKVNINFKSETFPLERMADILQINEIQQKVPGASVPAQPPAPPAPPATTAAPATPAR
jgi:hypothetical protein